MAGVYDKLQIEVAVVISRKLKIEVSEPDALPSAKALPVYR